MNKLIVKSYYQGMLIGSKEETLTNPIPKHDFWATKTLWEIEEYIEAFPKKQRAELYHVMMFTLNACHKMVKEEILDKEIFGGGE